MVRIDAVRQSVLPPWPSGAYLNTKQSPIITPICVHDNKQNVMVLELSVPSTSNRSDQDPNMHVCASRASLLRRSRALSHRDHELALRRCQRRPPRIIVLSKDEIRMDLMV